MTNSLHGYIGTLANLDESLRLANFHYMNKENDEELRYEARSNSDGSVYETASIKLLHHGLPHSQIADPRASMGLVLQKVGFHATPDTWVITIEGNQKEVV